MQTTRDNALFLRKAKNAHYLWPVLGNQPGLSETLNALPWETAPVAAATAEISRGRIETRTIRVLPCPAGTGFEDAAQAVLIERYTTYKKKAGGTPAPRPSSTSPASARTRPPRKTCSLTSAATGGLSTRTGYAT